MPRAMKQPKTPKEYYTKEKSTILKRLMESHNILEIEIILVYKRYINFKLRQCRSASHTQRRSSCVSRSPNAS